MAVTINSFDTWLSEKLQGLNTDEGVFGSYIKGILEGDETEDEKTEALEGILAGITEDNIGAHVSEILSTWLKCLPSKDAAGAVAAPAEDVEIRLAKLLESQTLPTTIQRNTCTEEERRIREAIVAQYSQMTDSEESDGEGGGGDEDGNGGGAAGGSGGSGDCGIEKNTNAANIAQQIKEKREQAKLDSQKKKEKDKEDREKQKQLKEEKKEKRKTVKGERRR